MEQRKGESTDRLELNQTLGLWTARYSLQSAWASSKCKLHTLIHTFPLDTEVLYPGLNSEHCGALASLFYCGIHVSRGKLLSDTVPHHVAPLVQWGVRPLSGPFFCPHWLPLVIVSRGFFLQFPLLFCNLTAVQSPTVTHPQKTLFSFCASLVGLKIIHCWSEM